MTHAIVLIAVGLAALFGHGQPLFRGSGVRPQMYCEAPAETNGRCWWSAKLVGKRTERGTENQGANWKADVPECYVSAVRTMSEWDDTQVDRPRSYSVACVDAEKAVVGQLVFVPRCRIGCVSLGEKVKDVIFADGPWEAGD